MMYGQVDHGGSKELGFVVIDERVAMGMWVTEDVCEEVEI